MLIIAFFCLPKLEKNASIYIYIYIVITNYSVNYSNIPTTMIQQISHHDYQPGLWAKAAIHWTLKDIPIGIHEPRRHRHNGTTVLGDCGDGG